MFRYLKTINEIETHLKEVFKEDYRLVQTENSFENIPKEHTVGLFVVSTPENTPFFQRDYVIEQIEKGRHIFIELCWVNNMIQEGSNLFKVVNPMDSDIEIDRKRHLFDIINIY